MRELEKIKRERMEQKEKEVSLEYFASSYDRLLMPSTGT